MLRYYFSRDIEIIITNDVDIKIVQNKNPMTQDFFINKEEAIAWATQIAAELNQTIVASDEKIIQPTDIEILQQQVATLISDNELLKGCVMELASIAYE